MDNLTADIKALLPQSKTVEVEGETITVRPFTFGQFPKVLPRIEALASLLDGGASVALLERHGEDLLDLVAMAIGKERAWVDKLDGAGGLDLVAAVAEVNADFFLRAILPRLKAIAARMEAMAPALAGENPPHT